MKLGVTEQHAALWIGGGAVTLLIPYAASLGQGGSDRPAASVPPPALVAQAQAAPPLPTTAQIQAASEKIRAQFVAEIQTGKATFTVFDGTPTATGIVATDYALHTGAGSYRSTLPVFLVGAKAGMGAANAADPAPAGKTILWAGDAYLAGTTRQGPESAAQSLYQYALSADAALALLSARRESIPSPDDSSVVARQ